MFRKTHRIRKTTASLALATAVAALAAPAAAAGGFDGRSPDTKDAAAAAHPNYGPSDPWYAHAVEITKRQQAQQSPPVLDGRSPDTQDAARLAHEPVVTVVRSPGFQWGDFGIGAGAALALMLLVAASAKLLARRPGSVATA